MTLLPNGWSHYLAGGLLIGSGVSLLFALTGLIGGMSSVYSSTWSFILRTPFFQQPRLVNSRQWRLAYAGGLIVGAVVWWITFGGGTRVAIDLSPARLLLGGVLVGFGARLSRGCTSGHGICGLASLGLPSALAVLTFMATAIVTANLLARAGAVSAPSLETPAAMAATTTSRVPVRARSQLVAAVCAGALFGFGLALSTMIQPRVVLAFLTFRDLGLMLVLGGAVVVTFVAYRVIPRVRATPLLGGVFGAHESVLDRSTIIGAAIFGVGWGICGVCPGPAIAGLGAGSWELLWAVLGIALGALGQGLLAARQRTA